MVKKNKLILWTIYEISSKKHPLVNNKIRGRLRKFTIENNINFLVENIADGSEGVRFAVFDGTEITFIKKFLKELVKDIKIELVMKSVQNPVLSKIKVNQINRY